MAAMQTDGKVTIEVAGSSIDLSSEDIQISLSARDGWSAAQGRDCVVVLSTELTPALLREGMARDVVRFVQDRRKELALQFTDRIEIGISTDDDQISKAIEENKLFIAEETLAIEISFSALSGVQAITATIGDGEVMIYVARAVSG